MTHLHSYWDLVEYFTRKSSCVGEKGLRERSWKPKSWSKPFILKLKKHGTGRLWFVQGPSVEWRTGLRQESLSSLPVRISFIHKPYLSAPLFRGALLLLCFCSQDCNLKRNPSKKYLTSTISHINNHFLDLDNELRQVWLMAIFSCKITSAKAINHKVFWEARVL